MPRKFDTVEDELDFIRDTTKAKMEYDIYFNNKALITTFNMTAGLIFTFYLINKMKN